MKSASIIKKRLLVLVIAVSILAAVSCNRGRARVLEVVYVSAPQAVLRDRVAAVFEKVGTVKNGDRIEVIDRDRRFLKVRTSAGLEGWLEQR